MTRFDRLAWVQAVERSTLSTTERAVLIAIGLRAGTTGPRAGLSYTSQATAAWATGLAVDTVGRLLRRLEAQGYLPVVRRSDGRSTVYRLNPALLPARLDAPPTDDRGFDEPDPENCPHCGGSGVVVPGRPPIDDRGLAPRPPILVREPPIVDRQTPDPRSDDLQGSQIDPDPPLPPCGGGAPPTPLRGEPFTAALRELVERDAAAAAAESVRLLEDLAHLADRQPEDAATMAAEIALEERRMAWQRLAELRAGELSRIEAWAARVLGTRRRRELRRWVGGPLPDQVQRLALAELAALPAEARGPPSSVEPLGDRLMTA